MFKKIALNFLFCTFLSQIAYFCIIFIMNNLETCLKDNEQLKVYIPELQTSSEFPYQLCIFNVLFCYRIE